MQRLEARHLIKFLDSNVRAGAYAGGAKLELTRLRLYGVQSSYSRHREKEV